MVQRTISISSGSVARHEAEEGPHRWLYPGTKTMADVCHVHFQAWDQPSCCAANSARGNYSARDTNSSPVTRVIEPTSGSRGMKDNGYVNIFRGVSFIIVMTAVANSSIPSHPIQSYLPKVHQTQFDTSQTPNNFWTSTTNHPGRA